MDRRHLLAAALVALAVGTGSNAAHKGGGPGMRPARDGNIAIQQELDAARRAGTLAEYDLFIARHPQHPLATIARAERRRLFERLRRRR